MDGWIDKNKDPLNDNVVEMLQKSTLPFVVDIWTDRKTAIGTKEPKHVKHCFSLFPSRLTADRRKKGSQFVTVGQLHKV